MAEFRITESAMGAGAGCICCGEFQGPFVDLQVLVPPPIYQAYLCAPTESRGGCIGAINYLLGIPSKQNLAEAEQQVAELTEEAAELKKKLRAKEFTVTGDELRDLVRN